MIKNALLSQKPIFSNFELFGKLKDRYHELRVIDLMDEYLPNDAILFMDELYNWIDSRTSGSAFNLYSSHIAYELRHTKRQIFGTAIRLHSIEMRWRQEWDYLVKATRTPKGKASYIPKGVKEREMYGFRWEIYSKDKDSFTVWEMSYANATKYFDYWDTTEIIPPYNKDSLEFGILSKNAELLTERIKKYTPLVAEHIRTHFDNRITRNTVYISLQELGIYHGYAEHIYYRIDDKKYVS